MVCEGEAEFNLNPRDIFIHSFILCSFTKSAGFGGDKCIIAHLGASFSTAGPECNSTLHAFGREARERKRRDSRGNSCATQPLNVGSCAEG